jgi:hypothetical protein
MPKPENSLRMLRVHKADERCELNDEAAAVVSAVGPSTSVSA